MVLEDDSVEPKEITIIFGIMNREKNYKIGTTLKC